MDQAAQLLADHPEDPALAEALVPILTDAAADETPGTAAYDEAAGLLVDAVVQSSEVGGAITEMVASIPADGNVTLEEMEAIYLEFLDTVSLTADEQAALPGLATNPPSDMEAEEAYALAVALLAEAAQAAGITDLDNITPAEQAILDADPNYALAFDFLDLGTTLQGGETSMIGDLLGGLAGNFTDPTP